jgi:hypothetical protein
MKLLAMQSFPASYYFLPLRSKYLPHQPVIEGLLPVFFA